VNTWALGWRIPAPERDQSWMKRLHARRKLQDQIWEQSLAVAQQKDSPINAIFLQSINETFDWSEKRVAAVEDRIPVPIWIMLVLVSMTTCLMVGLDLKRRFLVTTLVWPLMICIVMVLIADPDAPSTMQRGEAVERKSFVFRI
jgi:hypothetical protein